MDLNLMTPEERVKALDHQFMGYPLGGSFTEFPDFEAITASGYNESGPAVEGAQSVDRVELAVSGPAVTGDGGSYADMAAMNGTPWEGILAIEGSPTGDGRQFAENAITWAEPPLPLRHNIEDSHGGMPTTKTVLVGRIDEVYRDPMNPLQIMGRGVFDDQGTHGAEALRLVQGKFLKGVSVDPDDISDADVELVFPETESEGDVIDEMAEFFMTPELTIFHAGRLRAATLVDIPAFVEAQIWLSDGAPTTSAVAASAHFERLSDRTWSGPAQEARLSGRMTVKAARTAFAYVSTGSGETVAKTSTRFLHHEIGEDGAIGHANLTACAASMRTINSGRAEALSEQDRRSAYDHLAQHLRTAGLVPPPYESNETITASNYAGLERPPTEWFQDPKFTEVTPLTVTDDGRVFGHGAAWGTCHTSFGDACVTPPSEGEHAYFRLGEVVTADGSRVAVGTLTLGTGHAPTRNFTASQAAEHYDNTGTVVAVVASGEDDHGIWVAGAVRPGTPPNRVAELQAASLSGDWRRIGGKLRLVAFLAVNRPGFPIPRTSTSLVRKVQQSLVAAGIVTQDMRHVRRDDAGAKLALARIAKSIGRDPQSRMVALRARVRGE